LSAFIAGIACGTKYSAFALAVPLAYAAHCKRRNLLTSLEALGFMVIGFAAACPFSWLEPVSFVAGFRILVNWLEFPIPGLLNRILFPLLFPFPYCLGPVLSWTGIGAILWAIFHRNKGLNLLLLWLFAFFIGVYRCGSISSPGRVLIAAPVITLLVGRMIMAWHARFPRWRPVLFTATAGLFLSTLLMTLTIVRLHNSVPLQKQASQ